MKIVIGTPIRDVKGYSIGRWLQAISALEWDEPISVIAVDNTDDTHQEEFKTFIDTKIKEITPSLATVDHSIISVKDVYGLEPEARLVKAREKMREEVLALSPDVWFSVECDIILPPDTLKVLVPYLDTFDVVNHCYPDRENKYQEVGGIGCSLYRIKWLKENSFLDGGGYAMCNPLEPNCYYSGDSWFMKRLLVQGAKMVDFHNLLDIKHLGESE